MAAPAKELEKAQAALKSGQAEKAITLCKPLLSVEAISVPVRLTLSNALARLNRMPEAAVFIQEAALLQPSNIDLNAGAGEILSRAGQHGEAIPYFHKAVALEPTNSDRWRQLLATMAKATFSIVDEQTIPRAPDKKQADELVYLANRALDKFQEDMRLVGQVGEIFFFANLDDAALLCAEHALNTRPMVEGAHHVWLMLKNQRQAYDDIIKYAKQHADLSWQNQMQLVILSRAYEKTGLLDDALHCIEKAIATLPNEQGPFAGYLASKGRILQLIGRFDESIAALNKTLSILPDQPDARQNRCLAYKCSGNIAAAAKDEFARLELKNQHAKIETSKPIWTGQDLKGKRLFVWADMGVGDTFKYAPLIKELPTDCTIILSGQKKTLPFLAHILPNVEFRKLPSETIKKSGKYIDLFAPSNQDTGIKTYEKIEEDFDFHIPLAGLYTQLRPDMNAFSLINTTLQLPDEIMRQALALEILQNNETTKVGIAWSSINTHPWIKRNYMSIDDILPILRIPGFEFFNLQYNAGEEEINAFREKHDVPFYHAPGLDLYNDMVSTAAFTACMDLYIGPANTGADIAGTMGVKSFRVDQINLPESLGQDYVPWYNDQFSKKIFWGETILDKIPDMIDWLIENKNHRNDRRSYLQ